MIRKARWGTVVVAASLMSHAAAGTISIVNLPAEATDAASEIDSSRLYSHTLDFGADWELYREINNVSLEHSDLSDVSGYSVHPLEGMGFEISADPGEAHMFADGGMGALLEDYVAPVSAAAGSIYELRLEDLEPAGTYSLRIYFRASNDGLPWLNVLTFNGDGSDLTVEIDPNAVPAARYLQYDYVASTSDVTVRFQNTLEDRPWRLYGVTNELITPEPSVLSLLIGSSAILLRRRFTGRRV